MNDLFVEMQQDEAGMDIDLPFMAEQELKKDVATPLTDEDLRVLLGDDIHIFKYPDLASASHVEQLFDPHGRCIVLFLTENDSSGHWQCLYTRDGDVHFFDSYGKRPDEAFDWLSDAEEKATGQTKHELTRLLKDAERRGINVFYNTEDYQSERGNVATCGRWCAMRLLFKQLPADEFAWLVQGDGGEGAGDRVVTAITEALLDKHKEVVSEGPVGAVTSALW